MENITKKIAFIGDGGVGKTYLIDKINNKIPTRKYIPTFGINKFFLKNINNNILIYEYSGQEKYGKTLNIENYDIVFIMYDNNNNISKNNIDFWKKKCKNNKKILIINRKSKIDDIKNLILE